MRSTRITAVLLALGALHGLASPVGATQHLVAQGTGWDHLNDELKPGDEIILMPGRHRPVELTEAQGTAERPIVIRGLDPNDPPVIEADRYGIRLGGPEHVRIENVTIVGAAIHGLSLEGAEDGTSGHVRLENVTVLGTGPRGKRHAINLDRLDDVRVTSCRIEGWAGSGIEITACTDARLDRCTFSGAESFEQVSGIRVRAGSDRVTIDRCRFRAPGTESVTIGGRSELDEFRSPPTEDARAGSVPEATRVTVTRCVFEGGLCAVAFVHCTRSQVRQCTVVRPQQAVVSVRREHEDARFADVENCVLGSNLFTWRTQEVQTLAHVGGGADASALVLEDNLWWTPDWIDADAQRPPLPGTAQFPQVTDVDPALDERLRPTVAAAAGFGAFAE